MGVVRTTARLLEILIAVAAVIIGALWQAWLAPIPELRVELLPPSAPDCEARAQAVRCPPEGDLKTLETAGFAVLRGAIPPEQYKHFSGALDNLRTGRNTNVNGSFLETKHADYLPPDFKATMDAIVDRAVKEVPMISGGHPLSVDSVAHYATGRPGWPSWRQVPHHQDHESLYWYGSHEFIIAFAVVDKEEPEKENIDFVSFDALGACNPEFRKVVEGTAASISLPVQKVLNGTWRMNKWHTRLPHLYDKLLHAHEDQKLAAEWPWADLKTLQVMAMDGRMVPSDIDMELLNCTPSLHEGDVVLMRADVLHQTQQFIGKQTRRLALAMHYASKEHQGLSLKLLDTPGTGMMRGMARNPAFPETYAMMRTLGKESAPLQTRHMDWHLSRTRPEVFARWQKFYEWRFQLADWYVDAREHLMLSGWWPLKTS